MDIPASTFKPTDKRCFCGAALYSRDPAVFHLTPDGLKEDTSLVCFKCRPLRDSRPPF